MKYFGVIGFGVSSEKPEDSGIWVDDIVERPYYGDVNRVKRSLEAGSSLNDNINISNEISVVSDPFANENFHAIRYITWMNSKWKVTSVEVQFPRLILSIGGVYNAEPTDTAD